MTLSKFQIAYEKAIKLVDGGRLENYLYALELHPDALASIRGESDRFPRQYFAVAIESPLMPVDQIAFFFCSRAEWDNRRAAL